MQCRSFGMTNRQPMPLRSCTRPTVSPSPILPPWQLSNFQWFECDSAIKTELPQEKPTHSDGIEIDVAVLRERRGFSLVAHVEKVIDAMPEIRVLVTGFDLNEGDIADAIGRGA